MNKNTALFLTTAMGFAGMGMGSGRQRSVKKLEKARLKREKNEAK